VAIGASPDCAVPTRAVSRRPLEPAFQAQVSARGRASAVGQRPRAHERRFDTSCSRPLRRSTPDSFSLLARCRFRSLFFSVVLYTSLPAFAVPHRLPSRYHFSFGLPFLLSYPSAARTVNTRPAGQPLPPTQPPFAIPPPTACAMAGPVVGAAGRPSSGSFPLGDRPNTWAAGSAGYRPVVDHPQRPPGPLGRASSQLGESSWYRPAGCAPFFRQPVWPHLDPLASPFTRTASSGSRMVAVVVLRPAACVIADRVDHSLGDVPPAP